MANGENKQVISIKFVIDNNIEGGREEEQLCRGIIL